MTEKTHSATYFDSVGLDNYPTRRLVIGPVNRARGVHVICYNPGGNPVAAVSKDADFDFSAALGVGNCKPVNPVVGEKFVLGPMESLYGAFIVNLAQYEGLMRVLHMTIEDQSDAGPLTDIGTGVETAGGDRGHPAPKPRPLARPGSNRMFAGS